MPLCQKHKPKDGNWIDRIVCSECLDDVCAERDKLLLQVGELKKSDAAWKAVAECAANERNDALRLYGEAREAIEATLAFLQFDQPNGKGDLGGLINRLFKVTNKRSVSGLTCGAASDTGIQCTRPKGHPTDEHGNDNCAWDR